MPALGFGCGLATAGRGAGPPSALFDFTGGTMPAGATLTRASAASLWTAPGVLGAVGADVPRFDRDPVTGARRGLLIEPARTNLVPRHDDIATGWTNGQQVTGAGSAAPGGGVSQRVDVAAGSYGPYRAFMLALAGGERVTLSVHLRAAQGDATVAVGTNGIGSNANNQGRSVAIGAGWARRWFTLTAGADSGIYAMPFSLHASNGADGLPGVTGEVWGLQLEAGDGPTSLIRTTGAAAARAADRLLLDWSRFGRGDGPVTLAVTYDDASVQQVAATIEDGRTLLTTDGSGLTGAWLRRVAIV